MSAFVGALLVLTATSQGSFAVTVSACRAKPNHTVQCYGALGGSVILHLDIGSTVIDVLVKKGNNMILKYKNRTALNYDHTNNTKYFKNGTMKLDRASKNDSGEYSIDVHNAKGRWQWNSRIQLIIQAPLSKPVISQLCLPHGEVRVSCSSDGDVTEYNWTLGHKPLDGGVAYLKDEKDTVILKKNVPENITCSVRNHVSHNYTTVRRFACPAQTCTLANGTEVTVSVKTGEDFQPLLNIKEVLISVGGSEPVSAVCNWEEINQDTSTGVICEGIIFLSLAVCAVIMVFVLASRMYCLNRKRNRTGITGDNHTQELVYTEIVCRSRVKVGRGKEKEQETTTIYEKITAPGTLDHTRGRAHGQEDVVYARVQNKQNQPITEQMP
ncbi:uncharacterized protein LOC118235156 isoform X2 [Anguilla anguilla]|uniref:uncharacterized protein LOC118235156 isoform X2 n=1 Tax=Anguilla anguilla TaxID=7936 RepID=UPI0015AD6A29|nr:uncharacterized protein LOC118235156 isoform X2 [Anguilla anguilla]